jgi:hypothetical protein
VTRGVENERHRPLFMPYLSHMWRAPAGADSPVLAACLRAKLNFSKVLGVREAREACGPGYPREVNGHQARALSDGMQNPCIPILGCWAPVLGRHTFGRASSKPPFGAGRRPSIVPASSAPGEPLSSWPARVFPSGPRSLLIGPSQEKARIVCGMGPFRDARGSSSATQGGPDPAFRPSCILRAGTLNAP